MRERTWRAPKITHAWMAIQTLALLALVFVPLAPDRSRLVPAPVDGDQGEAAAQVVAVESSKGALELADAGDDLHTKLWFWQSAMGYTDNATVSVTVALPPRSRLTREPPPWWRRLLVRA